MVYPALLPLMHTTPLPAVDWTDAPANWNGLVRFAERPNLVSARVPSHFKRTLLHEGFVIVEYLFRYVICRLISFSLVYWPMCYHCSFMLAILIQYGFDDTKCNLAYEVCVDRDYIHITVYRNWKTAVTKSNTRPSNNQRFLGSGPLLRVWKTPVFSLDLA